MKYIRMMEFAQQMFEQAEIASKVGTHRASFVKRVISTADGCRAELKFTAKCKETPTFLAKMDA